MKLYVLAVIAALTLMFMPTYAHATPTALTVQELSETAWTMSLDSADDVNGNSVLNPNGDVFLILSAASNTETFVIASANTSVEIPGYGPVTKSNLSVAVAAGATKIVGPFVQRAWNDSAGKLQITVSGSGTPTIKAVRLKPSLR